MKTLEQGEINQFILTFYSKKYLVILKFFFLIFSSVKPNNYMLIYKTPRI